jgi:protein-disulfide isomerase
MRLAALFGVSLALVAGAAWAAPSSEPDDMVLGNPKAPVAVIEYASAGCPHCAHWANETLPAFKARYIDTGKARLVLREEITGSEAIAAAGFMVARCAGPEKYFAVLDAIFQRQADMFAAGTAGAILEDIAQKQGGLTDDAFKSCIYDQAALNELNARSARHADVDGVGSTPTFFIGKAQFSGDVTMDQLATAIAAAAPAAPKHHAPPKKHPAPPAAKPAVVPAKPAAPAAQHPKH